MSREKILIRFLSYFFIALIVGVMVSFLWSFVFHQSPVINWARSIGLAAILGVIVANYET